MASSDAALLERWIVTRDADAFAEIVSRYSALVYSTCKRVTGNPNDAEDVAQECFIELVRVRKTIRPSLGGWLHTVATRRSLDRIKAEARRKRREVRFAERVDMSAETTWDDMKTHIDEAIAALPDKLREPVVYRFLKGQTQNAIARNLGVSDSTVQYRLSKAIEEMRKFLKKRGVVAPSVLLLSLLGRRLTAEAAPATLTAALGKLTLASTIGAIGGTAGTSATGIATLGGVLIMKKLILSGIVLTCAIGGFVLTRQRAPQDPAAPVEITTMQDRDGPPREQARLSAEQTRMVRVHENAKGVRVTGKVVDSLGNPIEGAIVKLLQRRQREPVREVLTKTDGTFEFKGLTRWGSIAVLAEKEKMREMPGARGVNQLTESGLEDVLITLHYTATVEGVVVDPWSRPVVGEEVTARWLSSDDIFLTESAVTSGQGAFRIAGLLPGSHSLAVIPEKAGRIDVEDVRVELEEGEHRTGIRIVYEGDDFTIAGRVSNEVGEPVIDAQVGAMIDGVNASAQTDEDGRYRLTRLPEGDCMMIVSHSDYESLWESGIETGSEDVDFVLVALPSEGVAGRVIDADTRQPITDFWITQRTGAWQGRTWSRGRYRVDFRHDEQGRFWLKNVGSKEITIVADAVGYAPGYAAVHMAEGERVPEVIIPLSRGHVLEGTVVTTENVPVPGAYIFVDNLPPFDQYRDKDDFANAMTGIIRSEADGSFVLDNLEEGIPTTVVAYHFDHGLGTLELTPSGAETTGADIVLAQGGQIAGTVTLGGEPLPGARVGVWHDGLQTNAGEAETEADGSYVLSDVPEGSVDVHVQLPGSFPPHGHRTAYQYDILVQNGRTTQVSFDYPAGNSRLEGSVTLFGEPVERGNVTLRTTGPAGTEHSGRSVGINGRYVFRDVPAGPATLSVGVVTETGDWINRTINVEILEGEVTTVDVDLSGNSVVGGYVYGLGPFERGGVRVLSGEVDIREFTPNTLQELAPFLQGYSVVAYDGVYEIEGLEPGVYTLVAIATPRTLHGGYDHARFATTVLNLQENQEISLDFDLQ